ncbi:hypothetical protein ABEB36_013441 [Hypothenemus hampei]|uniref:Uncharacterized protein n=1 Tax=Hypothenemus hampei TaxID=57062 RepID=A0ABD1E827_HYPHA
MKIGIENFIIYATRNEKFDNEDTQAMLLVEEGNDSKKLNCNPVFLLRSPVLPSVIVELDYLLRESTSIGRKPIGNVFSGPMSLDFVCSLAIDVFEFIDDQMSDMPNAT